MNNMSDETKELMEKYIGIHGIFIMAFICMKLGEYGYDVEPQRNSGNIWKASVKISKGDTQLEYFFYNTFLEILCVDRDDDPLVFDPEILEDETRIFSKITEVLKCRLNLISGMIDKKSVEEIYNENPGMYERIRMRTVDSDQ